MPDLDRAPSDILEFVKQVAADRRPDLVAAGVTFACIVASPTEKEMDQDAPYLKFEKRAVPAFVELVKGVGPLHRVPDLTVYLDIEVWRQSDERERVAIVACALQRYALATDEHGQVVLTKYLRPKLVEVQPDLAIVGHRANVAQFGELAPEARLLRAAFAEHRAKLAEWGDDQAPQDKPPGSPFDAA